MTPDLVASVTFNFSRGCRLPSGDPLTSAGCPCCSGLRHNPTNPTEQKFEQIWSLHGSRFVHITLLFCSCWLPSCWLPSLPSGTLHPGDEIREINGVNVGDKSVENLQAILVSSVTLWWHLAHNRSDQNRIPLYNSITVERISEENKDHQSGRHTDGPPIS